MCETKRVRVRNTGMCIRGCLYDKVRACVCV